MVFSLRENTPGQNYSTVTDLMLPTQDKYIPFLTFTLKLKLDKKGNTIIDGYCDFDIEFRMRG